MSTPQRIIVASQNPAKAAEIRNLLRDLPVQIESLSQWPDFVLPAETGETFAENAALKARATARSLGCWSLADDSGLVVEALEGAPGLHSSRVAPTDAERIAWLLEQMASVPDEKRNAHFICVIVLADAEGNLRGIWEGRAPGHILRQSRGANGFGYDPIFYYEPAQCTFAEMSSSEKSAVSHRGRALHQFKEALPQIMAQQDRANSEEVQNG